MLTLDDLAASPAPGITPRGFIPAAALDIPADNPHYLQALNGVIASVMEHLSAYGISPNSTDARVRLAAKALARHYGAEMVLARARYGTTRDAAGVQRSLSSADLAAWREMRDAGLREVKDLLEGLARTAPNRSAGGVIFAPVALPEET